MVLSFIQVFVDIIQSNCMTVRRLLSAGSQASSDLYNKTTERNVSI